MFFANHYFTFFCFSNPYSTNVLPCPLSQPAEYGLEKLDREYTEWLEETRQKVAIGISQLERGESLDAEEVIEGILDRFREAKETNK